MTAQQSNPHGCAYGAVKAGLASFSRSLFDEARKYGVRVATVSPDMTKTELYRNADFTVGEETESYLLPQDVAEAVAYIVGQREGVAVSEVTLRPQYRQNPAQAGSEKGETGRMKDLTKGKPSTLILAFALPIFLGNLLQLTYSVTDTRIVGSFLGEDALARSRCNDDAQQSHHRLFARTGERVCHHHGAAVRREGYPGREKIVCRVPGARNGNLGRADGARTGVFTADPAVFECAGASDSGGRTLHIYHHSGTSCDIPL